MRGRRKKRSIPAWLALPLLAGAGWVNRDTLMSFLPIDDWRKVIPVGRGAAESPLDPAAVPAQPGRAASAMVPVDLGEEILDPMLHVVQKVNASPDAAGNGELTETVDGAGAREPVQMILIDARSRRALVGGKIVGIDDRIGLGKIVEITRQGVRVRADDGQTYSLRLAAPASATADDLRVRQQPGETAPANPSTSQRPRTGSPGQPEPTRKGTSK